VTAVAQDNTGATTTSAPLAVTVTAPVPNLPPVVTLTGPANGAVFTAPADIGITANASDSDGTVAVVEFYAGATLIGSDTTAPYAMSWNDVGVGQYALTAVARDNGGAMTVSGARDIRVDAVALPRTAIFTASTNHATAVDRYFLEIFPSGADPLVANPVATHDLGKPPVVGGECSVDISTTTVALPPGNYIATVTAIGPGGSARSAASPAFLR
jgi:chitinase